MRQQVQLGVDIFLQQTIAYKQQRIGFVTNDAAYTSTGVLSRHALIKKRLNIIKLFSPEHGISTTGADGTYQKSGTDTLTGLPVISLYADQLAPDEAALNDIDLVIFDIPDVGCRFYTYLWTMTHVMEACAKYKKPFIVLDRPNPIGADLSRAEGPMLDESNCASFVGRWNIPLKHCCTLGELAMYFAGSKINNIHLNVIKMLHYQRNYIAGKDFLFTPTSPAIQDVETALLYPGMGLLEGIFINEGRGTALPFRVFGAPWLKHKELEKHLLQNNLPGLSMNTISYIPATGIYAAETCYGLQIHITDVQSFCSVKTGLAFLQGILQLHPQQVKERLYKTNANPSGKGHLDKLLGVPNAFEQLQQGTKFDIVIAEAWKNKIKDFLLY